MKSVEQLSRSFAFSDNKRSISFEQVSSDCPLIKIENEFATATISVQGGQVLSWIPVGEEDVIWVSDDAVFIPGKAIRGGVPVCWPWFGQHESHSDYPAHGFARSSGWDVSNVVVRDSGYIQVRLRLESRTMPAPILLMWPDDAVLDLIITVGHTLTLSMRTENRSENDMVISQALHTYFRIDDIEQVHITGLEGTTYLDKTEAFAKKSQVGAVSFSGELDRVYLDTDNDVIIDDGKRRLKIEKVASRTTVVWNPGAVVATRMGDLGDDGYRRMVCVETANTANDKIILAPGQTYTLATTYSVL